MATTPMWQIFFSTLGGTLVGFFLAIVTTAYRERPRLSVTARSQKERTYVSANRRQNGRNSYTVQEPKDAKEAVLSVELFIMNGSAAYDAVVDVELEVTKGDTRVPARKRADLTFGGVNIPPRQTVSERVRFFLPHRPEDNRNGVDVETPDWVWRSEGPFPETWLHWRSVRRHFWSRKEISGVLRLDGDWGEPLHDVGQEIWYMHKPPA